MATNGKTKNGKRELTDKQVRASIDKQDRARLAELVPFAQHFPPKVIEKLHDNLMKHIVDQLEGAGMQAEADLITQDMFTLDLYLKMHTDGKLDPERALEDVGFCGVEEMQEAMGKALGIMALHGRMDMWV